MIKIYSTLLFIAALAFGIKAQAQCSGCTVNITGLDGANHLVSSGQTMCISPTGTVTGLITVMSGGTLCNQGNINSTNVLIAGGTFKNYGTINTYSVTVASAGTFTNYANALIDSLWITQANSSYINNSTQTGTAFAVSDNATAVNNGTITVYDHADSLASFTNNGTIQISHNFATAYNANYTNNGSITVGHDYGNSYSSTFTNNNTMVITNDFYNSNSATFYAKCMMNVNRDWYNSAYVYGPTASCGGFNVTGGTYNTGQLGYAGTYLDMCDAGHPTLGIDGPGGTIASTTTYCNCNNTCSTVTGIKEIKSSTSISTIYPNPVSSTVTVKLNTKENEVLFVEVRDMMGKTVFTQHFMALMGENDMKLNVSSLAAGTYILNVTNSQQQQSKQLFSVSK